MPDTFGIDERVWDAVIGVLGRRKVKPGDVALAASICPEMLNDGSNLKRFLDLSPEARENFIREGKFVWLPYKSLWLTEQSDLARECGASPVQIRNALAAWVMGVKNARFALNRLVRWDHKLGVWCACAVGEPPLRHRPEVVSGFSTWENATHAIKITRDWVRGRATWDQVDWLTRTTPMGSQATFWAVDSFINRRFAGNSASEAASILTTEECLEGDFKASAPEWEKVRKKHIERLCQVVAGAIMNFPSDDIPLERQ